MADDPGRPVTHRDFNALVQLFEEERKEFREFMKTTKEFMERANEARDKAEKEKKDEKEKIEKANSEAEQERADMKKKWDEGKMLEFTLMFLRINQGSGYHYQKLVHVKAE